MEKRNKGRGGKGGDKEEEKEKLWSAKQEKGIENIETEGDNEGKRVEKTEKERYK